MQVVVFHCDQLRKLGEGRRYVDSQQSLGIKRSAAVDGETADIVIGRGVAIIRLDTNNPNLNVYFRSDVLSNAPIAFGKIFCNAIVFDGFVGDAIAD